MMSGRCCRGPPPPCRPFRHATHCRCSRALCWVCCTALRWSATGTVVPISPCHPCQALPQPLPRVRRLERPASKSGAVTCGLTASGRLSFAATLSCYRRHTSWVQAVSAVLYGLRGFRGGVPPGQHGADSSCINVVRSHSRPQSGLVMKRECSRIATRHVHFP